MKRSTFISIGMVLTMLVIFASCDSRSARNARAEANTMEVLSNSSTKPIIVETLGKVGEYIISYKVKHDGVEYLVFERGSGVTVIEHNPEPKTTVAEPSKQSVATLDNPEVRPVPIGSEQEFIDYHSYIPNDGDIKIVRDHVRYQDISLVGIPLLM